MPVSGVTESALTALPTSTHSPATVIFHMAFLRGSGVIPTHALFSEARTAIHHHQANTAVPVVLGHTCSWRKPDWKLPWTSTRYEVNQMIMNDELGRQASPVCGGQMEAAVGHVSTKKVADMYARLPVANETQSSPVSIQVAKCQGIGSVTQEVRGTGQTRHMLLKVRSEKTLMEACIAVTARCYCWVEASHVISSAIPECVSELSQLQRADGTASVSSQHFCLLH